MASLVDADWFDDARYHGSSSPVAVVHAPRRLRTNSVQAVASRFHKKVPLTLISLSSYDVDAANKLSQSLHDPHVNVAFVATDEATYTRSVNMWPYQVIPAFAKLPKNAQWPRSRLSSGLVLTAVSRLVRLQYSVLVLHPTCGVSANFAALSYSLSSASIHISSNALIDKRRRCDCCVGPAYFPGLVAHPLVDMWADQLVRGRCPSYNQLAATAASAGLGHIVAKLPDGHIFVPPTATASPLTRLLNLFVACGVLVFWIHVCHLCVRHGCGRTQNVRAGWACVTQACVQRVRTLRHCVLSS